MKKIWQKDDNATNILVNTFTVGKDLDFDERLAKYDVKGSMAHCKMLAGVGIISFEESEQMLFVLSEILEDIENGIFEIDKNAEDIHSQIESILIEKLGDTGKKIHTARSRNDQVLLDIKLYLLDEIRDITALTDEFFQILIKLAEQHKNVLLPGYTHLQIAMPSSFDCGLELMQKHCWMILKCCFQLKISSIKIHWVLRQVTVRLFRLTVRVQHTI